MFANNIKRTTSSKSKIVDGGKSPEPVPGSTGHVVLPLIDIAIKRTEKSFLQDIAIHEHYLQVLDAKDCATFDPPVSKKDYQRKVHELEISLSKAQLKNLRLEVDIASFHRKWKELVRIESIHAYLRETGWIFEPFNQYMVKIHKKVYQRENPVEFLIPANDKAIDYESAIDSFFKGKMIATIERRPWAEILDDILEIDVMFARGIGSQCKHCGEKAGREYITATIVEGARSDADPVIFNGIDIICDDCIDDMNDNNPRVLYIERHAPLSTVYEEACNKPESFTPPGIAVYPEENAMHETYVKEVIRPLAMDHYRHLVKIKEERKKKSAKVIRS